MKLPALFSVAITATFSAVADVPWPQLLGPRVDSQSAATGLPLTWSESEGVKWKTPLAGKGWSSPVVADGQIWLTTAISDVRELPRPEGVKPHDPPPVAGSISLRAVCVDFATGKIVHDIEVFRPANAQIPACHKRNSYASPTPVLGDGKVFVHFGTMGTAALDAKTGKKLWENRSLKIEHQNGPGSSPALFGDRLLLAYDGTDQQFGVALSTKTGEVLWKTERSGKPDLASLPTDMHKAYGTPVVMQVDGQPQALTTASGALYAQDPATGRDLWQVKYPRGFSNVSLPVTDGRIAIISSGFMKPEILAVKLGGAKGDVTESHVLWRQKAGAPNQSTPVFADGRIYMITDGGIASCLSAADGTIVWKERIASDFASTPLLADGRLYWFSAEGPCIVSTTGDTYKELAKNSLDEGCMASPAVVGKSLVVRTKSSLYRTEK